MHQFEKSRAVEAKWAPVLDHALADAYPLERASRDDEWKGNDRFVIDDDGQRVGVEYKFDEVWQRTRNAFFETVSNSVSGRPGWLVTCAAKWLLYFLTPHEVLVFHMERLREAGRDWQKRYPVRAAQNVGYKTLGLCVPVTVARRTAESVSHIQLGDAIILQPRDEEDA
jgi:hypothetical protein